MAGLNQNSTSAQLYENYSTYFGGTGIGEIRVQPRYGEVWFVDAITVACKLPIVLESQCAIYREIVAPQYLLDQTLTGSTGDTSDTKHTLTSSDTLIIRWTGADLTTTGIATIRGQIQFTANKRGGFNAVSQ